MICSLSTSAIIDSIQATAAFQSLTTSPDIHPTFSTLLRGEWRGQMRMMIRNAFVDLILSLMPCVIDCDLDSETSTSDPGSINPADGSDILLKVEIADPVGGAGSSGAVIRRQLEHTVTMRALHLWALSAGDCSRAEAYASLYETAIANLLSTLTPVTRPFLRNGI